MRSIRLKDLVRLYDFVVVKTAEGERECAPSEVKPGEIVELPVSDRQSDGSDYARSDYALFKVEPDLVTPATVVEKLLADDLPGKPEHTEVETAESIEAYHIYSRANDEHPDWWVYPHVDREGEDNEDDNENNEIDKLADKIFDKILDHYGVQPGSTLADLIYEHVYAGLT